LQIWGEMKTLKISKGLDAVKKKDETRWRFDPDYRPADKKKKGVRKILRKRIVKEAGSGAISKDMRS